MFWGLIGRGFGQVLGDIGWSFVAVGSYRGAGRGYWEVFGDIGRYPEGIGVDFGEVLGEYLGKRYWRNIANGIRE